MSVVIEIILAVFAAGILACGVIACILLRKQLDALSAFVVEFRAHFDDAFVRKIMRKLGQPRVRQL